MADGFIRLPVDDAGKRVDTEELTVNSLTVQRERHQVAGVADTDIAVVVDTDPLTTDHGLVVRQAPAVNPKVDYVTSANLAAGASIDLDATTISAATTGKLLRVTVGASVPCKWEIKTRDGAVEVTKAVLFTGGMGTGNESAQFTPISKDGVTLAGAGVDENFRVTATNLSAGVAANADVHTTIEWDEV
jgi:hypothetical protein